ncbi:MAG: hypothetical protein E7256_10665 [Lachnospiraceae bacterium]|nr:hypothetical protein [Lachnospiraceae bacterium]
MLFGREDTTFKEMRENSVMDWLKEVAASGDFVNECGAKLTMDYIKALQDAIQEEKKKSALKDDFLKRLKQKK